MKLLLLNFQFIIEGKTVFTKKVQFLRNKIQTITTNLTSSKEGFNITRIN